MNTELIQDPQQTLKEEFEARQLEQIRNRWNQIVSDLEILRKDGIIQNQMVLEKILWILRKGPNE